MLTNIHASSVQVLERAKTAVNVEQATAGRGVITACFNLLSQLSREESEEEETFHSGT
jgi:hypothetical protein